MGYGTEGVSEEMSGVTNGKVLVFGGLEVKVPIFGPAGTVVKGVLENIMAVSGCDELNVICIGGCLLTNGRVGHLRR